MHELQACVERLQRENGQLRSQVEKASNLERMYEMSIVLNIK